MTFTHALGTNNYGPAKFIVDGSAANGTHTTIAAALTSSSSGDTIFIRPGTYTENLTLKAGVNLTAYGSDSSANQTGKVIISGTCTFTAIGSVSISGIQLQTNSAALLAVTGSAASVVNLIGCCLNCTNNTGITFSSSSATSGINILNSTGDIGTTGITLVAHSGGGPLYIINSTFLNSGASSTASTVSSSAAGILYSFWSYFQFPWTSSNTGIIQFHYSEIYSGFTNSTGITHGSTGSNCLLIQSAVSSGSGSAISISVNCTLALSLSTIASTNTNAITGAGTLRNAGISFIDTSSLINTTTQTARNFDVGGISFDGGTTVMSTYLTGTFTPTIFGSSGAGTPTYTAQNGYYTQIGNIMHIIAIVALSAITSATGNVSVGGFPATIKNQTNGNPIGPFDFSSAGYTWTAGYTSTMLQGNLNAITGAIIQNGSTKTAALLTIVNTATTFDYNLTYQV